MFWTESIAQYWSGEDILTRRESTFLGKSTWKNIGADGDTWAEKTKMVFGYQNSSDILWEKIVLVIKKNFWNSRLKAENLQNLWDH